MRMRICRLIVNILWLAPRFLADRYLRLRLPVACPLQLATDVCSTNKHLRRGRQVVCRLLFCVCSCELARLRSGSSVLCCLVAYVWLPVISVWLLVGKYGVLGCLLLVFGCLLPVLGCLPGSRLVFGCLSGVFCCLTGSPLCLSYLAACQEVLHLCRPVAC